MGRRRYVAGEWSTRTSTNCPGSISGRGSSAERCNSTWRSVRCSTSVTRKSNRYFFIGLRLFVQTYTFLLEYSTLHLIKYILKLKLAPESRRQLSYSSHLLSLAEK